MSEEMVGFQDAFMQGAEKGYKEGYNQGHKESYIRALDDVYEEFMKMIKYYNPDKIPYFTDVMDDAINRLLYLKDKKMDQISSSESDESLSASNKI